MDKFQMYTNFQIVHGMVTHVQTVNIKLFFSTSWNKAMQASVSTTLFILCQPDTLKQFTAFNIVMPTLMGHDECSSKCYRRIIFCVKEMVQTMTRNIRPLFVAH